MARPQKEKMQRKTILMPRQMIAKINRIAKARKVSFSQVVRDAIEAYDELSPNESALLEYVLDCYNQSTYENISEIDALMKRMDETHAILEAHSKPRDWQ